jgi:hypothetical protein
MRARGRELTVTRMSSTTAAPAVPVATTLRHQLFGAWCAPMFSVLTAVGWLGFAHFYDPAAASLSPAATADFFREHRDGILLGGSLFIVAVCPLALWTAQLGLQLREIEGASPLMAIGQVLAGVSIVVIIVIDASLWMGAAYRPGADGQIVQALNDAAWLGFLIAWPVLSMQMLCTAVVALHDRSDEPLFPRWLSWASIVGAVVLVTAGGPAFTHTGPFAFDGLLGMYLPVAIWGAWLDVHAWYIRKAVRRRQLEFEAAEAPGIEAGAVAEIVAFQPTPAADG